MTTRRLWLLLVVSACKAEPPPSAPKYPSKYAAHGIDVSRHNGVIDWNAVASAGVNFAWVKASEGGDVRDPRFVGNATGAEAAHVRSGPYHFFTFCRPGSEQAENFLGAITGTPRSLPIAVDVEFVGNCREPPAPNVIREQLNVWLEKVEGQTGSRVVIYSTPDAVTALLQGIDRPLWIRSIAREPADPWRFWQFDPSGRVPGIEGPVDLDVFRGAPAELESLLQPAR